MQQAIRILGLCALLLPLGCSATGQGSTTQQRLAAPTPRVIVPNPGFDQWVTNFRPRALKAGISQATLNRALRDVYYDEDVIRRDRRQAEFSRQIWDYLDSAVSDTRMANGRAALAEHGRIMDRIEAHYGVEKEVFTAVWGMESSYGRHRGITPVIPALATLAYDGRRGAFFESQLIGALKILQSGDIAPENMLGSWAGAMGHTQFIPTSYLAYAVDFNGDGRRDIWSDDPTDGLASAAAYLKKSGWTKGQPWGIEVKLPAGFSAGLAGKRTKKSPAQWQALGVRTISGGNLPNHGAASILLPAGASGPALMIFNNFHVILRYNNADSYAIGIGHLSDRLRGQGPFVTPWPRGEEAMTEAERKEMQELLTRRGFDTQGADGIIGFNTIEAIRSYQQASGLRVDGFPTRSLLLRLRG
jgi:membrane-bound lytic murein transglycosylase B